MTKTEIDNLSLEVVLALWIFDYLDETAVIVYLLKQLQAQPDSPVDADSLALSLAYLQQTQAAAR